MLRIRGGKVYDPVNGWNGEVRDICVEDGKIVPDDGRPATKTIDATGMVVMAGGVDIHAHIAGPKVNLARKMIPDYHRRARPIPRTRRTRSGIASVVPNTFATGYLYAGIGYTTAVDAAIAPLGARHAHEEFEDTPIIDKAMYILMGNNEFILERLAAGDLEGARHFAAWLLQAAKGYTIKVVNPGGVEVWKFGGNVSGLHAEVAPFGVRPRDIVATLARVATDLGLPHPVHIHCNNLGLPGNWETTLETMKVIEGHRAHITHIQFHSYGGTSFHDMSSKVPELVEYVASHPNITVDVGQVMFGKAITMTADGPWQYYLYKLTGERWSNDDIEAETGCGIVPYEYKDKSYVNTLQWAIGLEWFLLMPDPWRIALTTDHPNGSAFWGYPRIIKLLMSREARREYMAKVNQAALKRCHLPDLDREYSLYEIAIITRAAPARMLGLANKGHLGPGADADITIYNDCADPEEMFSHPRYVIKGGQVVVEDGEIRDPVAGRTLWVQPAYDPAIEASIRAFFEQYYTIQFENYPVDLRYLPHNEVVPCK